MAATTTTHQAATARCRREEGLFCLSLVMRFRLPMLSGANQTSVLDRTVEHVAAEPHNRCHVEHHHQRHQRQGDGNRSRPSPPIPFLLLIVNHGIGS